MPETTKNPPRYPFVIIGHDGPMKDATGKTIGYRTKAQAEARQADETYRVERIPLSDDIFIVEE